MWPLPGNLTSIEICAGGGGQAYGLELAGFEHLALVENDEWACETLRKNRPEWRVFGPFASDPPKRRENKGDITRFDATGWRGEVDLLAGGVPCPPFSKAGKRLGADDERDLFPAALRIAEECEPRAVMLENVPGLMETRFASYREDVQARLDKMGYDVWWDVVQSSDFGVPQLRPRAVLVALDRSAASHFLWPLPKSPRGIKTVGDELRAYMAEGGWELADEWAAGAQRIAPTLVGGSKKHGGPDLGPTRAKKEWLTLGVDAMALADAPPTPGFRGNPRLTVTMAAVLQGFEPSRWRIEGRKTAAYRQIGNAFPPPVAGAFGRAIATALRRGNASAQVQQSPREALGHVPRTVSAEVSN